jgi:hypothetical protein
VVQLTATLTRDASGRVIHKFLPLWSSGTHYLGVNTTTKVLLGFAPNGGTVKPERKSNEYSQVLIGVGKEDVRRGRAPLSRTT